MFPYKYERLTFRRKHNMTILSKFGVPLGGSAGRGGILQPKVKYKFRVRVINFGPIQGGLDLTQQVETSSLPSVKYDPQKVSSYNSTAYYPGKPEWDAVKVKVRDDVTNSVSKLIGHQVQKQQNHFEQTSPLAGSNFKFNMYIESMDGGNDTVIEQWYLEGCFLANVSYGDLDYSSSDHRSIDLDIRYDIATQAGGLMPVNVSGSLNPGFGI
jgi:hypothetical protein